MPKNVVEVLAALDRLFLVLRHHPVLGAPDAVFVDVGQVFLVLGIEMQVVEFGDLAGVSAGFRMARYVLDEFTAAHHPPAVAQGLEILFTGSHHGRRLLKLNSCGKGMEVRALYPVRL